MNDRERMLAEGPRVAPEPRVIDGGPSTTEPPPLEPNRPVVPNTLNLPGRRGRSGRPGYLRFLPVAIFALIAVARNAGTRDWPGFAVEIVPVALAVVVVALVLVRRLRANG